MRFLTCPQHEQRLVEGNQREAMNRSPPALATLVLSNCNSCPIAASATALASFRLAIIPRMLRSSMPITPQVRASSVVNLCCTSRRILAICWCLRATLPPLLLIMFAEQGSLRFRVFGLLFSTQFALQLAEFFQMES